VEGALLILEGQPFVIDIDDPECQELDENHQEKK